METTTRATLMNVMAEEQALPKEKPTKRKQRVLKKQRAPKKKPTRQAKPKPKPPRKPPKAPSRRSRG